MATFSPGDHSFTFAHFPVSMVAALATIEIIEEENVLKNCRKMGKLFTAGFLEIKKRYEFIGDVRGPGLIIAVEMVENRQTKKRAPEISEFIVDEGLKRGVIFGESKYLHLGNIVKVKPPLFNTENQVAKVLEICDDICEAARKRYKYKKSNEVMV